MKGRSGVLESLSKCKGVISYRGLPFHQSVWRPLVATVYDAPLALCDPRTVHRSELIEEDKVHEDHWEEGLYLKYRESQQWYWLSKQNPDEVTVFTTWDSKEGKSPGRCTISGWNAGTDSP